MLASENRLRLLCDITAKADAGFDAKINAILELGCQEFGLETGILSQITGDSYEVKHAVDNGTAGDSFLIETICNQIIVQDKPIAFEHTAASRRQHPSGYHKGEACIGAPVRVSGQVWGAFCFTSSQPRPEKFTSADIEFLRLMVQWIGGELERQRTEQELEEAKVEATLRESAARYSFLADTVPQIIWTARPDGCLDYYNKAWFEYTGMTLEQAQDWGSRRFAAVHRAVDSLVHNRRRLRDRISF